MQISYILFDLDDTLYPSSSGLAKAFLERILNFTSSFLGTSREEAERMREEKRKMYGTTLEWLQAEKGLSDPEAYFEAIHPTELADFITPDPALPEMIAALPQGCSILTNSPMEHAQRVSTFLGVHQLMDHIFDLKFNGLKGKPDLKAYQRTLDVIGVPPEEVLFIDDMPHYLQAFKDMGGHVLLVDEKGRHNDSELPRVEHILKLPDYLKTMELLPA
jgi:putative hydrolase of the HAD superfamily